MPIDLSPLATWLADFIDDLPTEATFRGQTINVRIGEAPQTRQMVMAGLNSCQSTEVLITAENCEAGAPAAGETITMAGTGYKVVTTFPLLSFGDPIGYRVNITRNP